MKRILALLLLSLALGLSAIGQNAAKKPRIMIVPSDALLLKMGLLEGVDDEGEMNFYQHYKMAFLNDEIRAVVAKFGELMRDRGFPITALEGQLKRAQNNPNYVVPRDIDVELNYRMDQVGPRTVLYAEFAGMDICSSKQIAGASGTSAPAIGATPEQLLQEAVIDKLDQFNNQLMMTFEDWMTNGREASLEINSSSFDLEGGDGGTPISDYVEEWLDAHCVRSAYSIDYMDGSIIQVSQAMMPLFDETGKAVDARVFFRPLYQAIKAMGLNAKFRNRGIGMGIVNIE